MQGKKSRKTLALNDKGIVVILRFLVILVTFFLTIYDFRPDIRPLVLSLVFGLFLATDILLIFIPNHYFSMRRFRNGIFLTDVIFISYIIYLTGGLKTDLYLIYFLIIFMAGSGRNVTQAFTLTIVVAGIYMFLLAKMGFSFSLSNPGLLLRIPFIFILSFVFLYYAQEEKMRMQAHTERLDKLSMIGEMTSEIIHEIKNPLTVIMGNAQLLDEVDPVTARNELWPDIVKATQVLSKKINSILAFVRSDGTAEKAPLNVIEVMNSSIELCRKQLQWDNVEIKQEFKEDVPWVLGHFNALEQVFVNIITNAHYVLAKYREPGDRKLAISVERKGKKVIARFTDNGPGIRDEDFENIFTPFYTTKPEGEGTGLGLSICYRIIKEHRGDIYARNEARRGASFIVELPAQAKA